MTASELLYISYFDKRKQGLEITLRSARETSFIKNKLPTKVESYSDFCQIPVIDSSVVAKFPESFVRGNINELELKTTGGSTGRPKRIYYFNNNLKSGIPSFISEIIRNSKHPILLHQDRPGTIYYIYDLIFKRDYPKAQICTYSNPTEALMFIKPADTIYIGEFYSAMKRFIYWLSEEVKKSKKLAKELKNKTVFIDVGGDPMKINELNKYYSILKEIFGTNPDIVVTYALTEVSSVGLYIFDPSDKKIVYKVRDDKYVEVLNEDFTKPLIEKEGKIIVTPVGWEYGTILLRYFTGDRGILSFKDGVPYLQICGRDPSKTLISLTGFKISAQDLYDLIRDKFNFPIRASFQVLHQSDGSYLTFKIDLYSAEFDKEINSREVTDFLNDYFINQHPLDVDIRRKYCRIKISTSISDIGFKDWKLLPMK